MTPDRSPRSPASASAPVPAPRPLWQRALPPVLAGGVVAALGWALLRPAGEGSAGPLVGKAAPAFELTGLDGEAVRLSDYRGRPVVVNFWASWCGPCREEAPLFARLSARPDAPAVVGILFNETKEQNARNFIRDYRLNYPNLRDRGVETAMAYNVTGIPHTVFIDREGVVRHLDRGGLDEARLNVGLAKIGVAALN